MLLNGIRNAAIVHRWDHSETEQAMSLSLRDSMHLVCDPENLEASVQEVFQTMLGVQCQRVVGPAAVRPKAEEETVTAVVGFGGLLSGACLFSCNGSAAMKVASLMTGTEFDTIDDTVKDGIGEICNMLAGGWKSKVPDLAANCGLSVPAVISGRDYNLHVQAPEFQLRHAYRFDGAGFEVTIVCDGLQ